jgi:uncharacterized protein (DUF305 family)
MIKGHAFTSSSSPRIVASIAMMLAAVLTSCGSSATNPPTAPTQPAAAGTTGRPAAHDAADVAFARNMIPHHQQAVVLAAMVPAHTANASLRAMATQIGADQQAEIRTLDGLLTAWNEPVVDPGGMSPPGRGMLMAGMVDQATLDRLQSLDDDAFDTLWVTSMIGHHQGAITMAQDEIAHGQSADAIHVARLIITAQQREIAMMTHLISASQ